MKKQIQCPLVVLYPSTNFILNGLNFLIHILCGDYILQPQIFQDAHP